jgi:hypothetical protein
VTDRVVTMRPLRDQASSTGVGVHRGRLTATAVVLAAVGLTGCAGTSPAPQTQQSPTQRVTPLPARTIVKNSRTVAAGRAVPFVAQRGITMRLKASAPKVSRGSLSSNYGYPPSHGYYVTFQLTIANTGSKPVQIGPGNFAVSVAGQGRVTSYDGNGPFSGAHAQLDNTEIAPGDVVRAPLSFDVRTPRGRLLFLPDNSAAVIWRF